MNAKEKREVAKAEAEKKKEADLKAFSADQESRNKLDKCNRKSLAKAAGLKSTFAVGNDLYMTSFGKGNDAIVEKKISGTTVANLNYQKESFTVDKDSITDMTIPIQSNRIAFLNSQADNPLYRKGSENKIQPDKLLLKDTLEKNYFGKTFNDTLHIQLIYNILDIEKILTVHSVNTVYALNNLFGTETAEINDLIGALSYQKTYNEFMQTSNQKNIELFEKFYNLKTLGYYGNIFFKGNNKRSRKEIYDIIALIATIRQWCIHFEEDKKNWLYNVQKVLSPEYIYILDDVYDSLVEKINKNFVKDNKVNIIMLSDILNMKSEEKFRELIKQYYKFIVTKEQKLLGFSIKKLREAMLEDTIFKTDKKYDSIRSKLYKLIDFILFYKYTTVDSEKEYSIDMIDQLRAAVSPERKEQIYKSESERLWKLYKNIIMNEIKPLLSESSISKLKKNKDYDNINIKDIVSVETANVSYFSKIIYLLAQFIDGKEVNDLTTTLIIKFDNIRSFIKTAEDIGIECNFLNEYKFFNTANTLKNELHLIKNLTGMGYYDVSVKHQMYKDAIDILGINDNVSDDEILHIIDDKILFLGPNGKPLKDKKGKRGIRNFIISNVIESSRFRYLVKYCNPKKIRKIANNEKLVKFVMERITETQLERYYYSCNPEKGTYPGHDQAVNNLTHIITHMTFDDFQNVKQNVNAEGYNEDSKEKMKYQTIISLYLTICYHLVKNLVNINARYAIAFHSLERDARLYNLNLNHSDLMNDQSALVKKILSDSYETAGNLHLRNKKWYLTTKENLERYNAEASKNFRNAVAHLNPIRNADLFIGDIKNITSYYDIYHYILQKSIFKRMNKQLSGKLCEYNEAVNKYHNYNKDFVKALCVPFAYNIVRFKSLSICELFDRNAPEKEQKETKN